MKTIIYLPTRKFHRKKELSYVGPEYDKNHFFQISDFDFRRLFMCLFGWFLFISDVFRTSWSVFVARCFLCRLVYVFPLLSLFLVCALDLWLYLWNITFVVFCCVSGLFSLASSLKSLFLLFSTFWSSHSVLSLLYQGVFVMFSSILFWSLSRILMFVFAVIPQTVAA